MNTLRKSVPWLREPETAPAPELFPADAYHVMDLLRRAHRATATCLVAEGGDPIWCIEDPTLPVSALERADAVARQALADGREHVVREMDVLVAVGDGHLGCGVLFDGLDVGPINVEGVLTDVRNLLAEYQVARARELGTLEDPHTVPDWLLRGPESLEGLGFRLCAVSHNITGRATAVVLRDPVTQVASVSAVSAGTDRRLLGSTIAPTSVAGRACRGDAAVVGTGSRELFGRTRNNRRRREEEGIAFPIRDRSAGVGALVVFGPYESLGTSVKENLMWLALDAGPRFGRAAAVRTAENRPLTDQRTGQPNRQALLRAIRDHASEPCSLVCADIDQFEQLTDQLGYAPGTAALRYVAHVFRAGLRDYDISARIGDEEFGLLLPDTPLEDAVTVAERVRSSVSESVFKWDGQELGLTCSFGVASVPETVPQMSNLLSAADGALHQAKEAGSDRITVGERIA